jgi:hypothetical protein
MSATIIQFKPRIAPPTRSDLILPIIEAAIEAVKTAKSSRRRKGKAADLEEREQGLAIFRARLALLAAERGERTIQNAVVRQALRELEKRM